MNIEVWIFAGRRRDVTDPAAVGAVRDACNSRGWAHRLIRVEAVRNSAGKPVFLLEPQLATNIYGRLHRVRGGVVATDDIHVRLNPPRPRLDPRWLVNLQRLVRYKGFYGKAKTLAGAEHFVEAFGGWLDRQECEGERDPRVLPLHSFCPSTEWTELDSAPGRERFQQVYGSPTRRVGEQEFAWSPDRVPHGGREPQNVAGFELQTGFHWDVTSRRTRRLLTLREVWEVPADHHVNVYPNGHVRGGPRARRVFRSRD